MIEQNLYLSMTLFVIALSLSVLVFTFKGQWSKKIIVMIGLILSAMLTYRASNEFHGHPAIFHQLDADVTIYAFLADKPNNVIYIWGSQKEDKYPKSFTIPYSKATDEKLGEVSDKNGGHPFQVHISAKEREGGHANEFDKIIQDETVNEQDVEIEENDQLPPKD